jgi:replicative DNA helicase
MDWGNIVDNMFSEIQARRDRGKELSIVSLPLLDDMLWGLKRKKLTVIGARPSQGKSSLLAQIALDLIQADKKVLYFSWEETEEGLTQRMLNNYAKVDNMLTQSGRFGRKDGDHNAVAGLKNILMKNNLHIIPKRGRTVGDFERIVRMPSQVDCVIVDYIQLIDKKGHRQAKEAYDEFVQAARELGKERNCAVLIASQINRTTVQNKQVTPPMMNELKGSGVIEEHADMIMLLHWDYFYNRDDDTKRNDYMVIVAKNKDGRTGLHKCYYYPQFYKVSEVPIESEHTFYKPKGDK